MARIYQVIKQGEMFIPTVRSDDEGWIKPVCKHKHHSEKEAEKCLRKVLPAYMKYRS